jgi:phosphoglycolate phosphatase
VPLTTLFFDLDGTLSNNLVGIARCLNYGLANLGYRTLTHAEVLPFVGPPFRESLPRHFPDIDVERALVLYRERYDTHGWLENDLYEGIADSIRGLYTHGYTIALCTSKPRIFAERIVEHFGLTRYFNGIHGPELDGRFDKKSDLLVHLLEAYKVAPEHAITTKISKQHDTRARIRLAYFGALVIAMNCRQRARRVLLKRRRSCSTPSTRLTSERSHVNSAFIKKSHYGSHSHCYRAAQIFAGRTE